MKFRKKPVVIDAVEWDLTFTGVVSQFDYQHSDTVVCEKCEKLIAEHGWIKTLEGGHIVCPNDWIITGVKGEKYPCKPDIFELTYEPEGDRPKIICLCGSSRFIESFAVIAWEFEKAGNITVGLHYLPPSYSQENIPDHLAEHEGVASKMDELHLKKIDLADEVFVINVNGYIGKSTSREIDYAIKLGKPIKYLESIGAMK